VGNQRGVKNGEDHLCHKTRRKRKRYKVPHKSRKVRAVKLNIQSKRPIEDRALEEKSRCLQRSRFGWREERAVETGGRMNRKGEMRRGAKGEKGRKMGGGGLPLYVGVGVRVKMTRGKHRELS